MALVELPNAAPILIVEDNEESREGLADYLRLQGFIVAEASNGRDAITLAQTLEPCLILLDVMMPGANGHEVLEALGRMPSMQNTPVVMTSDFEHRVPPGAVGALQKPLRLDTLLEYVHAYATRAQRLPLQLRDVTPPR